MFVRRNVWDLGADWADPVLWYARGVAVMKARALADPNGWRFYGAIHGLDAPLWKQFGYLSSSDAMPSSGLIKQYWKQCQHGSWYFLPWHRGYLLAFEANIRDAVMSLGGPKDWALPYWNYFKPGQNTLPPAFASADWPDGQGDNPLFVEQRWGPGNDGNVYVPVGKINLVAMTDPDFAGVASGGSPGFGGVDTGFEHGGPVHGGIETQPHDYVHGLVGGGNPQNPNLPGLMSDPDTAGLDPIFWLHHANIDRLWQVWRFNPPGHVDPSQTQWLKGPVSIGERAFSMPMPGAVNWDYAPGEMSDMAALGYNYDDLSPIVAMAPLQERLEKLGVRLDRMVADGGEGMRDKNVELLGANAERLPISGITEVRTSLKLEGAPLRRVSKSLLEANVDAAPDRVFLNLENVKGLSDTSAFNVYVDIPHGEDPADHPERLAGSVALFGVRKASISDEEHAGKGLTFVLDISKVVDTLHLEDKLDTDSLDVAIVPVRPVPDEAKVSIGRVSVYRQGR